MIDTGTEITIGNSALREFLVRRRGAAIGRPDSRGTRPIRTGNRPRCRDPPGQRDPAQCADRFCRCPAVRGVWPVEAARLAAGHRPDGGIPPGQPRFSVRARCAFSSADASRPVLSSTHPRSTPPCRDWGCSRARSTSSGRAKPSWPATSRRQWRATCPAKWQCRAASN